MDWRLFWLSDVDSSKKLKILRKKINWKDVNERREFLNQFCDLIRDWKGELPDLRDIFRNFVISCGYKDEPEIDRKGKPVLRRNTPIHIPALHIHHHEVIHDLFKIYNRFDVNYRDNFGFTHFLIVCECGFYKVAKKFLELGQVDLNYINPILGHSALHVALDFGRKKTFELLLRSGADPNLANRAGSTPLHILCAKGIPRYKRDDDRCDDCDDDSEDGSDDGGDDYMADSLNKFFMINDEKHQLVQIDAQDNKGNTPLQLAVKNLSLKMVGVLLDRGADPSNFVFPVLSPYQDCCKFCLGNGPNYYKLRLASRLLAIVERLEERGYQLGVNASNRKRRGDIRRVQIVPEVADHSPTLAQRRGFRGKGEKNYPEAE
ncbi:hypothetical protein TKK_0005730 [Trichogramma kaykai]